MTVGDIIKVTELSTGSSYEARIISGSPSAGLYQDEHGNSWWSSGVQWTPYVSKYRTAFKTLTCEIIKTAAQVRQESQEEQLMKVSKMIYDGVLDGFYSVENIAETIKHWRNS